MDHFGYRGMDLSGAAIFFKNVMAIPHCPTVTVHDLCCSSNLAHSTGYTYLLRFNKIAAKEGIIELLKLPRADPSLSGLI